jgi:hypothetical protein
MQAGDQSPIGCRQTEPRVDICEGSNSKVPLTPSRQVDEGTR